MGRGNQKLILLFVLWASRSWFLDVTRENQTGKVEKKIK